ncbi:RNA polymerase sigma factor [Streptacidiphilus cavernicola]|uniref:RNA polymerase sigma factor n=1 Tax=Streptacidiphilus cavernicola TaxID=3342716 RepID=A0ABV6VZB1_9ACTN
MVRAGEQVSGPPRPPSTAAGRTGDALLAARAAEGDDAAFETLVRNHSGALLHLAQRMLGDQVEAEDAVQECFLTAWRRLPDFRGQAAFGTWMYRIVTNRCLNILRARRPTQPLDSVPEPQAAEYRSSPARVAEASATVQALGTALGTLTPDQRACWILRELHHLSYEEIAEVVGIGEPAVRGRIFRARRSLMEAMDAWR